MRMHSQTEINTEVVRAMEKNTEQWLDLIDRRVPAFLHRLARAQTGVQGEMFYRGVQSGELSCRMYCFAKD
ncbi:MAG: hypothetical protein QOC63_974 [Mycobacterium sp.]|jgi:hypothetical protein|nr:hypothetical protein [Mycobacterium sp.]